MRLLPARLPVLLSLFAASLSAADEAPRGEVLELPPMTVTESAGLPEPEAWRHARLGVFEVLSNASDRETRRVLADFVKFQQAVRLVWPTPVKPLAASSIILCGARNQFDAFVPSAPRPGDEPIIPSLFLRNREQMALVVDLQAQQLTINDPAALLATGAASVEYSVDHYRQLYREYIHYLISQGDTRPPAWLEEGFAQIVMDIDLSDRTLILGRVDTYRGSATGGNPVESDSADASVADAVVGEQPFNAVLQHVKMMPFPQFFAVTHDSPEARFPLGNNLWAKQAYAFVHFCLFGENLRYKDALATFAARLAKEPPSEALFQECFKVDYARMMVELRGYILHTAHKYQRYDLKDDAPKADAIALEDATAGQIGLIKGDALRLAGKPSTAYGEYRIAYARGAREPALLAGLGATVPDPKMALKFTNAAVAAGVNRPSAYVAQARARLGEFRQEPGPDGRLTQVQLGAVLTPLFKAREFPPPLPETYATIAEAWALSSVRPKPAHLGVLDEGVRRFPRESALVLRTAQLYQEAGVPATAAAIARLGRRFAAPAAAGDFDRLLATLPEPAPAGK